MSKIKKGVFFTMGKNLDLKKDVVDVLNSNCFSCTYDLQYVLLANDYDEIAKTVNNYPVAHICFIKPSLIYPYGCALHIENVEK